MRNKLAFVAILALLAFPNMVSAGGVAIVETALTDNGDNDGYADTNETVQLSLRVHNTSGAAMNNVFATLSTSTPELICITDDRIEIGSLAVDETRWVFETFEFHVDPAFDRNLLGLQEYDDAAAKTRVLIESEGTAVPALGSYLEFDLDLDRAGGSGSGSFFESFEGTLGTFETENQDAPLHSLAAADGYRCQYNDPDGLNSNSSGSQICFPGSSQAHVDAVFWGLSGPTFSPLGGRGFSGFHSLFFGLDLGPPDNWTTPTGILESVRMSQPVHLSATTSPMLSFKHQASLFDDRGSNSPAGTTADRGVTLIQLADANGDPVGPWRKLYPYQNEYDHVAADVFSNCMFDPIDDGSTEDDYYDPTDPLRRLGPSSTCYPEPVFSNVGQTSDPFDATGIGSVEGPGLQGLWGIGTWVESRFDLSRYRGRSVRLRFLVTAIKVNGETWQEEYSLNPDPTEDGWWVDDVSVDQTAITPATFLNDSKDNSLLVAPPANDFDGDGILDVCDNCAGVQNALQFDADIDGSGDSCDLCPTAATDPDFDLDLVCDLSDNCQGLFNPNQANADGDSFGAACDCDDGNAGVFPGAPEVNDGQDNNCSGATDELDGVTGFHDPGDKTRLSWAAQGSALRYQIVRGDAPTFGGSCAASILVTPEFVDLGVPASGSVTYYLPRAFLPNNGSFGLDSNGVERTIPCAS